MDDQSTHGRSILLPRGADSPYIHTKMANNTCYETVQMTDGTFCLCLCSCEYQNGSLRITGIIREVGIRRSR